MTFLYGITAFVVGVMFLTAAINIRQAKYWFVTGLYFFSSSVLVIGESYVEHFADSLMKICLQLGIGLVLVIMVAWIISKMFIPTLDAILDADAEHRTSGP